MLMRLSYKFKSCLTHLAYYGLILCPVLSHSQLYEWTNFTLYLFWGNSIHTHTHLHKSFGIKLISAMIHCGVGDDGGCDEDDGGSSLEVYALKLYSIKKIVRKKVYGATHLWHTIQPKTLFSTRLLHSEEHSCFLFLFMLYLFIVDFI